KKQSSIRLKRLPYATRLDMLTFGDKGQSVVLLQGENLQFVPLAGGREVTEGSTKSAAAPTPQDKPTQKETPAHPVTIKDKKSVWFRETAAPEVTYISDRDYAIAKLPKELRGAALLIRTSTDVGDDFLPIGRLSATKDCTMFLAIQWDPTA